MSVIWRDFIHKANYFALFLLKPAKDCIEKLSAVSCQVGWAKSPAWQLTTGNWQPQAD